MQSCNYAVMQSFHLPKQKRLHDGKIARSHDNLKISRAF